MAKQYTVPKKVNQNELKALITQFIENVFDVKLTRIVALPLIDAPVLTFCRHVHALCLPGLSLCIVDLQFCKS